MRKSLAKGLGPSIDVTGDNNHVLMINGIQVNSTSILQEITNYLDRENRSIMLVVGSSCVFMITLLVFVLIYLLIREKHRHEESYMMLENIEGSLEHLNQQIQTIAFQIRHSSILLEDKEINGRSDKSLHKQTS